MSQSSPADNQTHAHAVGTDPKAPTGAVARALSVNDPVALYFERGGSLFLEYPRALWAAVAVALLVPSWFVWPGDRIRFLRQPVAIVLGLACFPPAIRYGYDRLTAWHTPMPAFLRASPEAFAAWLKQKHSLATRYGRATITGVVCAALAGVAVRDLSAGLGNGAMVDLGLLTVLFGFFAGVALYYIGAFAFMIRRLADFDVTVEEHPFGVRSVGRLMSTCWSIGALLWCLFMLAATQEGVRLQRVAWLPVAAAAVLIGSFVLCQLPLHQAMVRYKAGQVQRLEPLLRDLLNKGIEHLAPDEMQRVRFIEERIALAAKLPEWPAGWGSLVRVSWLSSLAPVLKYVEALVKDPHVRQIFARLSGTEGG